MRDGHQVLVIFKSQFNNETSWLKHYTELHEVCRLNLRCQMFPNKHLLGGKIRFRSTTLNRIVFGQFDRNDIKRCHLTANSLIFISREKVSSINIIPNAT